MARIRIASLGERRREQEESGSRSRGVVRTLLVVGQALLMIWLAVSSAQGTLAYDMNPAATPGALSSCTPTLFSVTPPCTGSAAGSRVSAGSATTATLPTGFQDSVVFSGLSAPTNIRFAPDGRVYVAEKSGIILVYSSLTATTPTVFANLSTEVDDYWDRGLLGMALDPDFPTTPYVYVLYTYDAPIGGTAPTWNDACPTPPGPTTDGCVVSGRLARLTADPTGNAMVAGSEKVLINDWCQQFPSHSIGDLEFGSDGALYATGGDGANFDAVDYGQFGNSYAGDALNPCGDPPAGVGGVQTPPNAEGGALRSQSLQRPLGSPVDLNGTLIRIDPSTGAAMPDNPLAGNENANAARIVAYGLRNPFRFAIQPGTGQVWIGNVGLSTWEAIDRVSDPTGATVSNFGWPCYEGPGPQGGYQSANLAICTHLYNTPGAVTPPYYAYNHSAKVVAGESCPTGSSSVTGLAFYDGGSYPAAYNGALFFADYSRDCIWAMLPGSNGMPNPQNIVTLDAGAGSPVDLRIGPGGDLFYADINDGQIHRIQYFTGCQPPMAVATATPTSGSLPLTVAFDGTGSSDPNGGTLTYAWDLTGAGTYTSATTSQPQYTYTTRGIYNARLRVTNSCGASSTSSAIQIAAGDGPPSATITSPTSMTTWKVGDTIKFAGSATDPQDGQLPASALSWTIILHHCPSNCHTHLIQSFTGVASGSFTAPDHEYPSYLEIRLTATDSLGLSTTTSVSIYPQTVTLTMQSSPTGLQVAVNGVTGTTPFNTTVIVGSANTVSATTPQTLGATTYGFVSWSDGGAQTHTVVAGSAPGTYTATYAQSATTWYFAEGYTGGNATEYLALANMGNATAHVTVKYLLGSGGPITKSYQLGANQRGTVVVNNDVGPNQNVSIVVSADQPIVAERPYYVTYTSYIGSVPSGTDALGATTLAQQFEFADIDTSAHHETWLTVLNPQASAMTVTVSYFPAAGGAPVVVKHTVAANHRGTIFVNGEAGLAHGVYSAVVSLSQPGLVERPLYQTADSVTGYPGAADVMGVAQAQTTWYFAEGYTSATVNERYILANPTTAAGTVHATVTFYRSDGSSVARQVSLNPGQQVVVSANAALGNGGVDNSAVVTASAPIVAERLMSSMYVGSAGCCSQVIHAPGLSEVLGASSATHVAEFAEGYTGGQVAEYLTIVNPSSQAAHVTVTFLPASGAAVTRSYTIGAHSRFTLYTNGVLPNQWFAMTVQSDQPIVAERPMAFIYNGWAPGSTDVIGYQPAGS